MEAGSPPALLVVPKGASAWPLDMEASEEPKQCPARGSCPVFLAMSSGVVRYAPSGLSPVPERNFREEPWDANR